MLPKDFGQHGRGRKGQRCHHRGSADRVGQRIAGHRLEQAGPHARARDTGTGRPEPIEIASAGDRQRRRLLALDLGDAPATRIGIIENAIADPGGVDLRRLAIISVLDEHAMAVERQQVDEAIAGHLIDRGVHDHRPLQSMRLVEPEQASDEFLPAEIERGAIGEAPRIDHPLGRDPLAVGKPHPVRFDLDRTASGVDAVHRQGGADRGIEPLRLDRIVIPPQGTLQLGEGDIVPVPAMADQRFDQRAIARRDIAVEEGPDMVAAERRLALDDRHR